MIREQIHSTPEYQQVAGQQGDGSTASAQPRQAATVGDALAPVMSWEKGDVEFWLQVAQLVILVMILREMRGGA